MVELSCYYSLSSPWAYLGGPKLREAVERHRVKLILKPFDFQDVVPRTGGVPLRTRPEPRRTYHALELDRWRKHLGMPLPGMKHSPAGSGIVKDHGEQARANLRFPNASGERIQHDENAVVQHRGK